MTLISKVWDALNNAGVSVRPIDAQHLELRHGSRVEQVLTQAFPRGLHPSDVVAIVNRYREPGLLVLPAATAEVRSTIERAGWSWLVTDAKGTHGVLWFDGEAVTVGGDRKEEPPARGPGPIPWGTLTVVRRLLDQPVATQKVLAALSHVSQPRVSQVLDALVDRQLVARRGRGWVICDFDRLLRWWLDNYPGPGGISTYWYGVGSPRDQAQAALRLLATVVDATPAAHRQKAPEDTPVGVLSGDVAADLLAPWRIPTRAVIYARTGADLTDIELTPVTAQDATLELIVPQDPGVWPSASSHPPGPAGPGGDAVRAAQDEPSTPIADPLQVLWDVLRTPGSDSSEAAAHLWRTLREHNRAATR